MSWELEADVTPRGDPWDVADAFIHYFSPELDGLLIESWDGQSYNSPRVSRERISWRVDRSSWRSVASALAGPGRYVRILLILEGATNTPFHAEPKVHLYGDDLPGLGTLRRRAPLILSYGNRQAWRGKGTLNSGAVPDEETVLQSLIHICRATAPHAVDLLNEEGCSVPFDQHFVFRGDERGFLQDLKDIIQISLRGGAGAYQDGRAGYEAIVDHPGTMLLCKRQGEYRQRFLKFLETKLPRLAATNRVDYLTREIVEDALITTEDLGFINVGNGIGIWNKPPFGGYVELFYLNLIERLLGEVS